MNNKRERQLLLGEMRAGETGVRELHMAFYVLQEKKRSSVSRPSSYEQCQGAEKGFFSTFSTALSP